MLFNSFKNKSDKIWCLGLMMWLFGALSLTSHSINLLISVICIFSGILISLYGIDVQMEEKNQFIKDYIEKVYKETGKRISLTNGTNRLDDMTKNSVMLASRRK